MSNLQGEIVHPMEAKTQGLALFSPAPAKADTACTERTPGVQQEGVVRQKFCFSFRQVAAVWREGTVFVPVHNTR